MNNGSGWSRCCRRRSLGRGGETRTPVKFGPAFCGSIAPARRGVTCRGATARWARCRAGSTAGARLGSGSASCRTCKPRRNSAARSTGTSPLWTPPSFVRISTLAVRAAMGRRPRRSRHGRLWGAQGGFSTKLHLRAEGHGRPITVVLTGGERNEQIALEAVLDQGAVRRPGRGRPRLRAAACDKGYSSPTARARLRRRHIRPVIPTRKDQPRQRNFDREAYRLRNKVERLINRLKQARRVATRYEKRGDNYLAMVHIGMILLWLKPFADTA